MPSATHAKRNRLASLVRREPEATWPSRFRERAGKQEPADAGARAGAARPAVQESLF